MSNVPTPTPAEAAGMGTFEQPGKSLFEGLCTLSLSLSPPLSRMVIADVKVRGSFLVRQITVISRNFVTSWLKTPRKGDRHVFPYILNETFKRPLTQLKGLGSKI